jgi:hypothetical protein
MCWKTWKLLIFNNDQWCTKLRKSLVSIFYQKIKENCKKWCPQNEGYSSDTAVSFAL